MSLKQKAYTYIKSKIVNCDFPPDVFLNEKQLMAEIGVSRTPIREALSKLEHENLVSIMPNRGVSVCGLTASEINMIFQTRELIEPYIVLKDGKSIGREVLESLRTRMAGELGGMSVSDMNALDDEFHKVMTSGCRNPYLLQVLDHLHIQLRRLQIMNGRRNVGRVEASQREHLAIVDLLLSGDIDGAAEADRRHLANARAAAIELLINT